LGREVPNQDLAALRTPLIALVTQLIMMADPLFGVHPLVVVAHLVNVGTPSLNL
jgi:hypothetical protein